MEILGNEKGSGSQQQRILAEFLRTVTNWAQSEDINRIQTDDDNSENASTESKTIEIKEKLLCGLRLPEFSESSIRVGTADEIASNDVEQVSETSGISKNGMTWQSVDECITEAASQLGIPLSVYDPILVSMSTRTNKSSGTKTTQVKTYVQGEPIMIELELFNPLLIPLSIEVWVLFHSFILL